MRNFSMNKLGTPMRAAPGCASEIVGFWSVGEPSVLRVGFDGSGVAARLTLPTCDSAFASTVGEAPVGADGVCTLLPLRFGVEPLWDELSFPPAAGEADGEGLGEGEGLGDGVAVWVGEGTAGVAPGVAVAVAPAVAVAVAP